MIADRRLSEYLLSMEKSKDDQKPEPPKVANLAEYRVKAGPKKPAQLCCPEHLVPDFDMPMG